MFFMAGQQAAQKKNQDVPDIRLDSAILLRLKAWPTGNNCVIAPTKKATNWNSPPEQ